MSAAFVVTVVRSTTRPSKTAFTIAAFDVLIQKKNKETEPHAACCFSAVNKESPEVSERRGCARFHQEEAGVAADVEAGGVGC